MWSYIGAGPGGDGRSRRVVWYHVVVRRRAAGALLVHCRGIPRDMRKVPAPYGMARGAIHDATGSVGRRPFVVCVPYVAGVRMRRAGLLLPLSGPDRAPALRYVGEWYHWERVVCRRRSIFSACPQPYSGPEWQRSPCGRVGCSLDRPIRMICAAFSGSVLCGARAPDRARRHAHCIGRPWHVWPPYSAGGCAMPHARPATPLWGGLRLYMWRRGGSLALPQAPPARHTCGPMSKNHISARVQHHSRKRRRNHTGLQSTVNGSLCLYTSTQHSMTNGKKNSSCSPAVPCSGGRWSNDDN